MAASLFFIGIGGGMVVPLQTKAYGRRWRGSDFSRRHEHAAFNTAHALGLGWQE